MKLNIGFVNMLRRIFGLADNQKLPQDWRDHYSPRKPHKLGTPGNTRKARNRAMWEMSVDGGLAAKSSLINAGRGHNKNVIGPAKSHPKQEPV